MKKNYKVRYTEYGHPYRVRLNVKLLVSLILGLITTFLWMALMVIFPISKNMLMLVSLVSIVGYTASYLLYLNSKQ